MNFLIYSVEDDPNIALILNKTLSKQGYTVQSFPNGTSFWEAFSKEQPQMVLLDMMLPDIPGSELLKKSVPIRGMTTFKSSSFRPIIW